MAQKTMYRIIGSINISLGVLILFSFFKPILSAFLIFLGIGSIKCSCKSTHEKVLDFILNFRRASNEKSAVKVFNEGCCYWFAVILKHRFFPLARIYYSPVDNHFVAKIGRRTYDITGEVTSKYKVVPWLTYPDELHRERLKADCINYTRKD